MSRKNHKGIDGKFLQTDKNFSALKSSQQEKICNWLREEYLKIVSTESRLLTKSDKQTLVETVYKKLKARTYGYLFMKCKPILAGN
ncbi:hypothetical protein [Aminipila sp.]|uniref:hypothetical protein n=1 Tax=Aminipila sp. TaxID=2060095 RepID=UPI00289CB5DB|nr:hypothetical protein [Aminipila sp.]